MKTKPAGSFYQILEKKLREQKEETSANEQIRLDQTIRRLRNERKLKGTELCRRAGDLDPKTLTAVEKGRIQNPSVKTLLSIARGLGVTVADLFRQAELNLPQYLYLGSQKGAFQIDFSGMGVKVVSFTPFIKDFFCGKLIFAPEKRIDEALLKHPVPVFVSALIGRFEVRVEDRLMELKEGENLFFNGILRHSFYNPLHRESVLLLVTAPSFI